jgi:uncharacterized protein
LLIAGFAQAAPVPQLQSPVNDYANVISADDQQRLRDFLLDQEHATSNQIVILTINSLGADDSIESFANKVFNAWKLGQVGKDNGVLVVAAVQDRKVRIEVGRGLESTLTDAIASEIIRNEIVPSFKSSNYAGGFLAGVTSIDKTIHGLYIAKAHILIWPWVLFLSVIAGITFAVLFLEAPTSSDGKRRYWWGRFSGGTSSGGIGGGMPSGGCSSGGGGGGGYSGGGGSSGGGGASGGW